MILEILIFLFTSIICYYLYLYKKLHGHFKDRGVKYLAGVPLFGNILSAAFSKKHFLDELGDVYNAFPEEKYVGFFELTTPIVLIRDPELTKNIIVKDFDHFTDRKQLFSEDADPLFAGSLLLMKGEKWRHMRNILSPAFTASKMKHMLPVILKVSHNIVEYLNERQNHDTDIDDLMRRYANDVIALAGFGLKINSFKDKDNDFYKIGQCLLDFNFKQRCLMLLHNQLPQIAKRFGWRIYSSKIYEFFSRVGAATMSFRRKENVIRPDMIQLLMNAQQEWTAADLTGQVFIFFAAGFETSSSGLVMTIHELAINQDVQEKLYQECRKFKEEKELTFENLSELKYLDGVINESLRKWASAIILDRTCTKTYELPPTREGGKPFVIKPGEIVYNLPNQVQMDPKYWPEPHKFDPERFSDENKHKIKPFTFMPFGVGPRSCIGMRFAIMETKVLLYHLVLNFKIVKTAKTLDPIEIVPHLFSIKAVGGTNVQFEKRQIVF